MENGLTFDSSTRTVTGAPTDAAKPVLYRYTAVDEEDNSVQLTFIVTVFDVSMRVDGRDLADVRWGVLDHKEVRVREQGAPLRTTDYRVRVGIPASAGFQLNSTQCTWPAEPPTSTKTLWSNWVAAASGGFKIVRCGLGSGEPANIQVQIGPAKEPDKPASEFQLSNETIPQAWHRNDNRVNYYLRGAIIANIGGNREVTGIRPTSTASQEGLFIEGDRPDHLKGHTVSALLTSLQNYTDAAQAWTDVCRSEPCELTISRVSSAAGADVIVEGYWDEDPGGNEYMKDGKLVKRKDVPYEAQRCGVSVACIQMGGVYPHLRNELRFYIEEPPHWGASSTSIEWTTDFGLAAHPNTRKNYHYLPKTLMHEFGHSIGLAPWHSMGNAIMTGTLRKTLSNIDKNGAKASYNHHTPHGASP